MYLIELLTWVFDELSSQCQALVAVPWGRNLSTNLTGGWVSYRACLHT